MSSDPDTSPPQTGAAPPVARRRFLQALSRDAVDGAVQVAGLAAGLHGIAGEAMGAVLGRQPTPASDARSPAMAHGPSPTGLRPYRVDAGVLHVLDARSYPGVISELMCSGAADIAAAIRERHVTGATVLGELAAYAAWLAVVDARAASRAARRTRIRTMGAALRSARPGVAAIDHATWWLVDAWDRAVSAAADDAALEAACRAAADAFAARLATDRTRSAAVAAGVVGALVEGPLHLVTMGGEGIPDAADAGGGAGVAVALAGTGRAVRVTVLETRTEEAGARMTAWGLAATGLEVTVTPDAALGALLAGAGVDAVVIGADTITPDGTVMGPIGIYPLAVLAKRHAIPLLVVAPSVVMGAGPDADMAASARAATGAPVDPGRPSSVHIPTGSQARRSAQDITPQALVSAFVTEDGRVHPPLAIAHP